MLTLPREWAFPLGAYFFSQKLAYANFWWERSFAMTSNHLEQMLAAHCAPTLLGAKCASLMSLSKEQFDDIPSLAELYSRRFSACGLCFQVVCDCGCRSLLLVYRPALLRARLQRADVAALLHRQGYPLRESLEAQLAFLRARLARKRAFPHEIGLFLGYPPADVACFIRTGGAGCKLSGYWKVYTDVDAARETFACYDACRACLQHVLASGQTISQLLCAA